jgi:hypothetical protein
MRLLAQCASLFPLWDSYRECFLWTQRPRVIARQRDHDLMLLYAKLVEAQLGGGRGDR